MSDYDELRREHNRRLQTLVVDYLERLSWTEERLRVEREHRLRELVRIAGRDSPWHRERLASIDPWTLTEDDLSDIPPMTKGDLMGNWDRIVTDGRLSLDLVNSHLENLGTDEYLFDRYHATASGGSSGHRGVFVYDWDSWALLEVMSRRWMFRDLLEDPGLAGRPKKIAHVSAPKATHITNALLQTFSGSRQYTFLFPVTLPIARIVEGLNRVQPTLLTGYASALHLLAREARAGRLEIAPRRILSMAEPLFPAVRMFLEQTWEVPVTNIWGCAEGAMARSCGRGRGMHLSDDLMIIEPVDRDGRPVPPGAGADRVFFTNLYNPVLPLIRYEITDELTLIEGPCACGCAHRRIDDVLERKDEIFSYTGNIRVHTAVIASELWRTGGVVEYQVRQTRKGVDILLRCMGGVDVSRIRSGIAGDLEALGLEDPDVSITRVERIERLPSGKTRRFIPSHREP